MSCTDFLVEYVTCKICKSPDTLLGKENRLYFMTCESCGSRKCCFLASTSNCQLWHLATTPLLLTSRSIGLGHQGGLSSTDRKENQGGVVVRMTLPYALVDALTGGRRDGQGDERFHAVTFDCSTVCIGMTMAKQIR